MKSIQVDRKASGHQKPVCAAVTNAIQDTVTSICVDTTLQQRMSRSMAAKPRKTIDGLHAPQQIRERVQIVAVACTIESSVRRAILSSAQTLDAKYLEVTTDLDAKKFTFIAKGDSVNNMKPFPVDIVETHAQETCKYVGVTIPQHRVRRQLAS